MNIELVVGKWTMDKEDGLPYRFEDFVSENNGTKNDGLLKLQGVLSFVDASEKDGGFCCVPGFHKHLAEWAKLTQDTRYCRQGDYTLVDVPQGKKSISFILCFCFCFI